MRLSSIEIKGFKSFADKTVLHFTENMTGVVGPNGCGKSNTVDAIRWVLGEQKSKMLRLEKMDNIIFNGSKKRQPSGRAEVSLTLENTRNLLPTEFSTVTISRILYRSGDSEYRLNDVRCRLKDITDLFLDTGIGSDSYAIIELKMIDEILNDKDNSRSRLFEQAAGISKYKIRKKETLSKLAATDADLTRIEDLLFEIEKNLKILEKQAKQTEKYYKLRNQYKELSVELALHQLQSHKAALQQLKSLQQTETDNRQLIETQIAQTEAGIEHNKLEILNKESLLKQEQQILNEGIAQLRTYDNNKNLLEQNIAFLKEKTETLDQQINNATQLTENLTRETDFLAHDLDGEKELIGQLTSKLQNLQQQADFAKTEHNKALSKSDELKKLAAETEKSVFEQEKKLAVLNTQKDNLQKQLDNNQSRLFSQQQELEQLRQGLEESEKEHANAQDYLTYLQDEEESLKSQIAAADKQLAEIQLQLNDLNRLYDARLNEFNLLKSMVDSLEGFPDSVKYLKQNANQWNTRQAPLLLDVINCPDEYKVAVENYLKPYLNHYVLNTWQEASTALQLLDKNKKGKAGFFILEDLNSALPLLPVKFSDPSGKIQSATGILTHKPEYKSLAEHLLYRVFIVSDDFEPTTEQLSTGAVFISQNGKSIRTQASVEGGSVGAYEGKRIGKRQQLEQLTALLEQLKTEAEALQNGITQHKNRLIQLKNLQVAKQTEVKRHQNQTETISKQILSFKLRIENLQSYLNESQTMDAGLATNITDLQNQTPVLEAKLAKFKETLNAQNLQIDQDTKVLEQANNRLILANNEFNRQNIEFHKQQNRLNTIEQNLSFKQKQLAETNLQLTNNLIARQQSEEQHKKQLEELNEIVEILAVFYRQKEEQEKKVAEVEADYTQARNAIAHIEKQIRELFQQKHQADMRLNNIEQQFTELKINRLSIKERLDIEFQVNIEDLLEQSPKQNIDLPELEDKVEKTRAQISKFGEINPLAIEAYNEIKERYDFIIAQRQDLVEAKKSLLKTMREIEKTATEKLMEAFNQIRTHFVHVFRALFTEEDACDLLLTDPENPLESEIDIIARPKGKRPQSINQLSGGEKSLTALALIFALYLFKPAPFCILDEVDAPLDDANITKFSNMIRRFSEQSQFILVTHNKNTMAAVDVIYGVTMPEEGVSKVVPVDFRALTNEYQETALTEI